MSGYVTQTPQQIYRVHENEKKRQFEFSTLIKTRPLYIYLLQPVEWAKKACSTTVTLRTDNPEEGGAVL